VAVEVGAAAHEVGAGLADLDAIGHQADVMGIGVLATHVEAVVDRFQADVVAALAFL
jgi:hypothetical protein